VTGHASAPGHPPHRLLLPLPLQCDDLVDEISVQPRLCGTSPLLARDHIGRSLLLQRAQD
jgi:hypothetical protein